MGQAAFLSNLEPKDVVPLLKKAAAIHNRYVVRDQLHDDLQSHIIRITKPSKKTQSKKEMDELRTKLDKLLQAERRLVAFKNSESAHSVRMKQRIEMLQAQLSKAQQERTDMELSHTQRIKEINDSLALLRERMGKLILEKKVREKASRRK